MRDKVLCSGWTELESVRTREEFLLCKKSYFSIFTGFLTLFLSDSVPVSIQGGVKMSIDEFLSFFDGSATWNNQKAQKEFLEMISRRELDTIYATESLFKGTVVDFGDLDSHSGGGNYAYNDFSVS
jgi:prepilin-type processing-associated H-X9-DG protein